MSASCETQHCECPFREQLGVAKELLPRLDSELRDHERRLRDHGEKLARVYGVAAGVSFAGAAFGGLLVVLVERLVR